MGRIIFSPLILSYPGFGLSFFSKAIRGNKAWGLKVFPPEKKCKTYKKCKTFTFIEFLKNYDEIQFLKREEEQIHSRAG